MKKTIFLSLLTLIYFYSIAFNSNISSNYFSKNNGQIYNQFGEANTDVLYIMQANTFKILLRKNGFSYQIEKCLNLPISEVNSRNSKCHFENKKFVFESSRIDFDFINSTGKIEYIEIQDSKFLNENIFYNSKNGEMVKTSLFNEIIYKNIYPGIDIVFSQINGNFKYDIHVEKGSDIQKVKFLLSGAENILLTDNKLIFKTQSGEIGEEIPASYEVIKNKKEFYKGVKFRLSKNVLSFNTDSPIHNKLIIDPMPSLMWGTYYGGNNMDIVLNITSDNWGNVIAIGQTMSTNNIATNGSHQATYIGDFDLFVVKFNKDGIRQWGTYYGGTDTDRAYAVSTDNSGNIYVGGSTYSNANIVTPGAWQVNFEGPDDAFLVKFNAAGVRQWATYYGGELHDFIAALTIDNNGDIVLTGHSRSTYNIATPGTHQPSKTGIENCIISKFGSNGNLIWGSYFGNGPIDEGWGVDVDSNNNIYVGGWTESLSGIATPGAFQLNYAGNLDGFITKFTPNGTQTWGTYFGGSSLDHIWSLSLDNAGNVFVGGDTESNSPIATPGAFQTNKGSYDEAHLQKFDNNGQRIWGTFIGGNSADYLYTVESIKTSGDIIISGYTESDINISTPKSFQPQRAGAYDAMIMQFNNNGQKKWGTYYGGLDTEECKGMAIAENNNIIIGGHTFSTTGIATNTAHQQIHGGGIYDGFIAKICVPVVPVIFSPDSVCSEDTLVLSLNQGFLTYLWQNNSTQQQCITVPQTPGIYNYWVTTVDTNNCPGESDTISITVLPKPLNPVITQNGNVLESTVANSYQWYLNGVLIPGAIYQSYTVLQNGSYSVLITDTNGCNSMSEIYTFVGMENYSLFSSNIKIFPNPTSNTINISFSGTCCEHILVTNTLGETYYDSKETTNIIELNTSNWANGLYIVKGISNDIFYSTFVVQH